MSTNNSERRGRRLRVLLGVWAVVLVVVIAGFIGWAALRRHTTTPLQVPTSPSPTNATSSSVASSGPSDQVREDQIAAAPMLAVPQDSNQPSVEVQATTPPMQLPAPTGRTVEGVAVYPHTAEGAVAQLAAMDSAASKDLNVDRGRAIHDAWALPGAVPVNQWSPTLSSMSYWQQNPNQNPNQVTATVTPVQGIIKGTVGTDWVLACFNGRFAGSYSGTLGGSVQQGVAECARMQWSDNRWMLGPGIAAAPPPLVWPRSALSYQGGFRDLVGVK